MISFFLPWRNHPFFLVRNLADVEPSPRNVPSMFALHFSLSLTHQRVLRFWGVQSRVLQVCDLIYSSSQPCKVDGTDGRSHHYHHSPLQTRQNSSSKRDLENHTFYTRGCQLEPHYFSLWLIIEIVFNEILLLCESCMNLQPLSHWISPSLSLSVIVLFSAYQIQLCFSLLSVQDTCAQT